MNRQLRIGTLIVALSMAVGISYVAYISNISFPHDAIRAIPFVWLIGSIAGFIVELPAFRTTQSHRRLLFLIFVILNVVLACYFSLGALMGD